MKLFYLLIISIYFSTKIFAQKIVENYTPQKDSLRYGNGKNDFFPYNDRGYTLIAPSTIIKGTVVTLEDDRMNLQDTSSANTFYKLANAEGFAYLHISTGMPVELFFNEKSLQFVDAMLIKIFNENKLPQKNIFFLGIMTSGHRALKYVEYCQMKNSPLASKITGVVLCESALDWVRQWYEGQKQVRDSLTEVGHFEGKMVTYLFEKHLKCTPLTNMEKMVVFSPYSYFDAKMRHIPYYKKLAVRAYTFADTDYWFSASGKGVFDSNYPDMSGIINELKLAGSKKAELIVFQKENKSGQHTKQSGTWGMVDKKELLDWITKHIN
jgi:hypothetical protein